MHVSKTHRHANSKTTIPPKKRTYKTNPTYPVSLFGESVINDSDKYPCSRAALIDKFSSCSAQVF